MDISRVRERFFSFCFLKFEREELFVFWVEKERRRWVWYIKGKKKVLIDILLFFCFLGFVGFEMKMWCFNILLSG